MTDRQTSIALHLAKMIGLYEVELARNYKREMVIYVTEAGEDSEWNPYHDRAQCMEVIEWAAMNGYGPTLEDTYCLAFDGEIRKYANKHNNTPEGIRAAALEAIARATGWPGMEGE